MPNRRNQSRPGQSPAYRAGRTAGQLWALSTATFEDLDHLDHLERERDWPPVAPFLQGFADGALAVRAGCETPLMFEGMTAGEVALARSLEAAALRLFDSAGDPCADEPFPPDEAYHQQARPE